MENKTTSTTTATASAAAPSSTPAATAPTSSSNSNSNGITSASTTSASSSVSTSLTGNSGSSSSASSSSNSQLQQQQEAVKTFEHLLRKSQRLFVGLRDLPQFGRQWQPFFQKTFELYTKLWKHQQLYRSILEDKTKYGLKRCEIGEIASKIGQLYYHYYLRTSDTNYLNESYIFYEAIRLRSYFKDVSSDTKMQDMMVKQLRYYARFIVVCLLLNRKKVVFELVEELFKHVKDYTKIYKPNDAHEWSLVIQEIFAFLHADQCISFTDNNNQHVQISHRLSHALQQQLLSAATNPNPNSNQPPESIQILQQAILVGNHQNQIKFSEITLDMFRMTQSLEYETPELKDPSEKQQEHKMSDITAAGSSSKKKNPHKYLLYRPTITQLLLFLSNSSKELGENKALLLYLSVDGVKNSEASEGSSYANALLMNAQKTATSTSPNTGTTPQKSGVPASANPAATAKPTATATTDDSNNNFNCSTNTDGVKIEALYPVDLIPFCRKPFFLIIDSQCSNIFRDTYPPFNQPFVSLLSPLATPKKIISNNKKNSPFGNLFTFFLHDPLGAFCDLTACNKISLKSLAGYQAIIQSTMVNISKLLFEPNKLHQSLSFFMMDDFLRSFIVRFVFCHAVFHLHKEFHDNSTYQVSSNPTIPSTILLHESVLNSVLQLATALNASDQFINPNNNNNSNSNNDSDIPIQNLSIDNQN